MKRQRHRDQRQPVGRARRRVRRSSSGRSSRCSRPLAQHEGGDADDADHQGDVRRGAVARGPDLAQPVDQAAEAEGGDHHAGPSSAAGDRLADVDAAGAGPGPDARPRSGSTSRRSSATTAAGGRRPTPPGPAPGRPTSPASRCPSRGRGRARRRRPSAWSSAAASSPRCPPPARRGPRAAPRSRAPARPAACRRRRRPSPGRRRAAWSPAAGTSPVAGMTTAMVSMKAVESHWAATASTSKSAISRGIALIMMVSLRITTKVAATSQRSTPASVSAGPVESGAGRGVVVGAHRVPHCGSGRQPPRVVGSRQPESDPVDRPDSSVGRPRSGAVSGRG